VDLSLSTLAGQVVAPPRFCFPYIISLARVLARSRVNGGDTPCGPWTRLALAFEVSQRISTATGKRRLVAEISQLFYKSEIGCWGVYEA
jgi:hypothetical protein